MRKTIVLLVLLTATALVFAGGQQEGAAGDGDASNFNEVGYPIVNEPVTLTVACQKHGMQNDVEAIPLYQEYLKRTNINVDLDISPGSGWAEKRNLILASGDLPDILGNLGGNDLAIYYNQDIFAPIDGYLDSLAPNLQRIFTMRPDYEKAMRLPDGHIYSWPKINELPFRESPDEWYINKAWVEKLGLSMPTNLEELYEVMVAFKENDCNGNGDNKDEIPFTFIFDEQGAYSPWALFGAWGVNDGTEQHIQVENGKVVFTAAKDGYKEGIKWLAKCWDAGLIDPETFTHTQKEYFSKGKAGEYPIYGVYFSWMIDTPLRPEWLDQYVTMPPLPAKAGAPDPIWTRESGQYLSRNWSVITTACDQVDIAVRFLDGLLEEEFTMEWARGPFGTVMKREEDGSISLMEPPEGMSTNALRFAYAPWILTWAVMDEEYRAMDMGWANNKKMDDFYNILTPYLPDWEEVYPQVFYTTEESEELAILQTDLHDFVARMRAQWVTGEQDVEAGWDNFIKKLDDVGLQRYLEIQQAAMDRYYQ